MTNSSEMFPQNQRRRHVDPLETLNSRFKLLEAKIYALDMMAGSVQDAIEYFNGDLSQYMDHLDKLGKKLFAEMNLVIGQLKNMGQPIHQTPQPKRTMEDIRLLLEHDFYSELFRPEMSFMQAVNLIKKHTKEKDQEAGPGSNSRSQEEGC